MNQTEIRDVLTAHDVLPSKALGQNFLCDANIARWIVDQLDLTPDDCVVEVGPGTGALTEHLVGRVRKVILIEFDSRLAQYHKDHWADHPEVEVHHADGAQWDIRGLFKERPVKFLGNLPYSAGGAILSNFLSRPCPVDKAVVMLQKEFIDRILATPDDDAYGILSLRMQMNWIPKALKTVPPEAFHPRPRIDSTVMSLEPRPLSQFPPYDYRLMDDLMKQGFSQRRKQMRKQMPESPSWEIVTERMPLPVTARAEELSLKQWIDLTRIYDPNPLADLPQRDDEQLDVVDENNAVTGQDTRKNIHDQNLKHRAVHLFVFTKKRCLVLQKRSYLKDRHPGVWDSSAAGHVDAGESYEDAARRELKEELGLDEDETTLIGTLPASEKNGWEFVELRAIKTATKLSKMKFPAAEIETIQAFSLEEIAAWIKRRPQDFASSFRECFDLWMTKMN